MPAGTQDRYTIGLDFGTLSARAVVVRVGDGTVVAEAVHDFAHGVMDRTLDAGDGHTLPPDFALEVPADYIEAIERSVHDAMQASGVDPEAVIGLGVDATSSTVVVTDAQGTPLCERPEFANNPHAYIKLWKHHGGQSQAERIVELARQREESWLGRYGGTLSSEMLLPKILETFEEAPEVYAATEEVLDVLDWLTWKLTGRLTYAAGDSGYKRMYQDGSYPSRDFLEALAPGFGGVFEEKMSHEVLPLGARVGGLDAEFARAFGLPEGIAVASGNIDAHVHAASVDAVRPGQLTGILGTSVCWVLPSARYHDVPGTFGVVDGGIADGSWGFECGQSAVGDCFAWFIENCVPASYIAEAEERGLTVFGLLAEKAAQQEIGEHGLVALDWWNGNRSILVDGNLTGLMVGQTLATTPEDQYRAIQEACCFGARVIIENFEEHGVPVDEIRVAGGLLKDSFLMQMYADITRRPLSTATVVQAGAQGSAIFAAVAAGAYPDLPSAAASMGGVVENAYVPREEASRQYDRLYEQYRHLYELFGREDPTMHALKEIRRDAMARRALRPGAR
ncbi:MAG: ribulokinase [Propionibacterium sp.]|nr:ribulokinase [Propionibacterium sp.]